MTQEKSINFRTDGVTNLAQRVRSGETTAHDLVQHALNQINEFNGTINAFVALDPEAALKEAHRIDSLVSMGEDPGPLAGIPLGVKDLEDASGFATTLGSNVLSSNEPVTNDSFLVARLKASGAIVVGLSIPKSCLPAKMR